MNRNPDDLGFKMRLSSAANARAAEETSPVSLEVDDTAAERHGWDRRHEVRRKRIKAREAAADQINIRGSVPDINAFIAFCQRNRLTLGEGLAELVAFIPAAQRAVIEKLTA